MPKLSPCRRLRPVCWLIAIAGCLFGSSVQAQTDYFWQAPLGGAGNWDVITPSWSLTAAGPPTLAWPNSGGERANFGGAGAFVGISNGGLGVSAFGVNFQADGYTLFGDPLTLTGAGGVVDTSTFGATIASPIGGTVGLTKNGTGTLTLSGASTYTGGTTVSAGVIDVMNATALGAATSTVTVASGAVVQVDGATSVTNPLTLNGTGVANGGALRNINGNNTWARPITLGSDARINSDTGTLTINNGGFAAGTNNLAIGGAGAVTITTQLTMAATATLTHDSASTLTISGGNTGLMLGAITVTNGGILSYPNQTSLGGTTAGEGVITLDNGTLFNTIVGNAGTFSPSTRNIVLNAGGGTIQWNGDTVTTDLIIIQTNTVISGVGGLTKAGAGIISVVTPATYQGPTHVAAGTLRVRTNNNVYPIGTALTVDSGALFDLNGLSQQVGSLSGAGNVNTNAGTFTVGDTTSTTFSGVIGNNTGAGKVTKVGSGTLTLTGANTYTGATTVSAGTLAVGATAGGTGSLAASAVSVASGATLAGFGTVNGAATVAAAGILSPGAATPGTLSFGNNLTINGVYAWKLATAGSPDPTFTGQSTPAGPQTNHDALSVIGVMDLTGSTLNLTSVGSTGFNSAQRYSWIIATAGSITSLPTIGTISGSNFSGLTAANFTVVPNGGNQLLLNYAPVPEPAFVLLACAGAVGAATWIRKRRQS